MASGSGCVVLWHVLFLHLGVQQRYNTHYRVARGLSAGCLDVRGKFSKKHQKHQKLYNCVVLKTFV